MREYALIGDVGNLDVLKGEEREQLLEFLNPYSTKDFPKRERSIGVICYSENKLFANTIPVDDGDPRKHEEHFATLYASDRYRHQKNLSNQLEKHGVTAAKCVVYLVAVPDVAVLREEFYRAIGIEGTKSDCKKLIDDEDMEIEDE